MDLFKLSLMKAVRSELEELKRKILRLEEVIARLRTENEFLRSHVSRQVLIQLQQKQHLV
jgi:regulator of replication initiation timing